MSRPERSPGLTLLEVVVAVGVITIGALAAQRLVTRSVRTITDDRTLTDALLVGADQLAAARLNPPPVGRRVDTTALGVRIERHVRTTPHPELREVHIRVVPRATRAGIELVELIRVPLP